ncbi:MAG TPA: cupin domain-containing protein [Ruminiclostridium sp.]|nr:cupin domain-containing protein [Ruminiclostridium sp.]
MRQFSEGIDDMLKNIDFETAIELVKTVEYQKGQVVSKTLAQNKAVSLTLFAFDKGEEISSHSSDGDAMVYIMDGKAEITIGEKKHDVEKGETIVMPAGIPHALFASEQFKMLLIVVFPS